jgi:telomere length regulation protein
MHQKYITFQDEVNAPVQLLLQGISREVIDKSRTRTEDQAPQLQRERQLRIRPTAKVTDITPNHHAAKVDARLQAKPRATFTAVAAEYFVYPLVNRFWTFLRDEQTREERTSHLVELHRYRGGGTGLVLNALVLAHLLGTLSVLMHAARNASEWITVLAPDVLELATTLGTRPMSMLEEEDSRKDASVREGEKGEAGSREASVLSAALELAVVVVDGCIDLDGGRALSLDHTALLLGVGEWANEVFARLDKGERAKGGGGVQEARLSRAAAALILKVDEVTSRWRRSMLEI